jgi:regulator of replication initiation timing
MKSTRTRPTSDRVMRNQPIKQSVPTATVKNNIPKKPKLSTLILEEINIPETPNPNDENIKILYQKIDDLSAAKKSTDALIESLICEIQSFRQTITEISEENAALKRENEKLKNDVNYVYDDMNFLMGKVERLEQKALSNNVEITGVPAMLDEDLSDVLQRLFHHAELHYDKSMITDAYRLNGNNKSGLPGSIIVSFCNHTTKNNFMEKTKGKVLNSSFLNNNHHPRPVYINEHLTRLNKYLFYLARCMRREGQIKYVWVVNGRVLVKVIEGAQSIIVECPKTLENLKNNQTQQ